VQDQGPGISPADRDRLFTDFARLSARPTGGEKSTGLGLAITRRVVEAHGGIIDVDSTPGQGATFWVWLPAQPPA
jgi:signal transduction histidine kinase